MERLTFEGRFCDIAKCTSVPGGSFCENGSCSQRKTWERLKAYEDTGLTPEDIDALRAREQGLVELLAKVSCGCAVTYDRLGTLAQADQDGRLVILPEAPKEGDQVPDCFYNYDGGDLCMGMAKSVHDDEPTEKCKRCWYCESTRQDADAAVESAKTTKEEI